MIPIPNRYKSNPSAEINVVPYIDVMLVLLVIFMITTPILEQGVEVELPVVDNSQTLNFSDDNEPVVITVDRKGSYSVGDRKKLIASRIIAIVQAKREFSPAVQVMVKGDKNVAYGKVIELITFLQIAGIEKVGFITESEYKN